MVTPRVGHVRHPRVGVPSVYIGRTMLGQRLKDVGWGNPFRLGVNSDDPVADYAAYLDERPDLTIRMPELVGRDLLCWCRVGPLAEAPYGVCHGDVLLERVKRWEREHPEAAEAIRTQLRLAEMWRPITSAVAFG